MIHDVHENNVVIILTDQTLENIEELRQLAVNNANPVYFWRALSEWFVVNEARVKAGLSRLEMPKWCEDHLAIFSRRLRDLSEGLDYTEAPEPFGSLPANWDSVERARRRKRTLTPTSATKLVLHALELRRNGRNAFERALKLEDYDEDALSITGFRENGMSEEKATNALLDDYRTRGPSDSLAGAGITDRRSIQKRVTASRNARRPKPT